MIAGDPHAHARNAMRVYDYMAAPLERVGDVGSRSVDGPVYRSTD